MNLAVDQYLTMVINTLVPEQVRVTLRQQAKALEAFEQRTELAYCNRCESLGPWEEFCENCDQHICNDIATFECSPCNKGWCQRCCNKTSTTCQICNCDFCDPGCGGFDMLMAQCCGKIMDSNCYRFHADHKCLQ